MNKGRAIIYINPDSRSTEILNRFLAKYIDQINQKLFLDVIRVNSRNIEAIKKAGIEHTPTLVYGGQKYVSLEKIIRILSPPSHQKDSFGYGNMSSNDLIHGYQQAIIESGEEETTESEDMMDPDTRTNVIRQKMASFQKRRPQITGVENAGLSGGRMLQTSGPVKSSFDNDDDFRRAARVDNIVETPVQKYMDDTDGAMLLEEYFLDEAVRSGKKVDNTSRRRRPIK